MKKYLVLVLAGFLAFSCFAQDTPVKIVFDVTNSDAKVHQSAIRHVKGMSEAYPDSEFEVVLYSGGLEMVWNEKSSVAQDIQELSKRPNVSFVVCEQSMAAHNVKKTDLVPGVETVPDGILEIAHKQQQDWSYIKEQ